MPSFVPREVLRGASLLVALLVVLAQTSDEWPHASGAKSHVHRWEKERHTTAERKSSCAREQERFARGDSLAATLQ